MPGRLRLVLPEHPRAQRARGHPAGNALSSVLSLVRRHPGLAAVEAVWLLFAANFNYGFLHGSDAQVPYTFLRRLTGQHVHAYGYQFGLAFFELPFYAVGKGLESLGLHTFRTHPMNETLIAFGTVVYVALTVALVYKLLRYLGLRHAALAAGLALFGTSLFFYGVFSPGQTHVVDTLLSTLLVLTAFLGFQRDWPLGVVVVAGVIVGTIVSVRIFDGALGFGLFAALVVYRRIRPALVLGVASLATFWLLAAVPLVDGVHLLEGGYSTSLLRWSPGSPFFMLFTLRRGLFVWTPITAVAVLGYALLLRRDREHRPFLVTIGLMTVALVAIQALVPFWGAGFSFSQRYFTALMPIVAVGIGGVLQERARIATAVCLVSVAWSLFLALTMVTLPYDDQTGGVDELVQLAGTQSVGSFSYGVWHLSHLKILVPGHPFASN